MLVPYLDFCKSSEPARSLCLAKLLENQKPEIFVGDHKAVVPRELGKSAALPLRSPKGVPAV